MTLGNASQGSSAAGWWVGAERRQLGSGCSAPPVRSPCKYEEVAQWNARGEDEVADFNNYIRWVRS